ncbi:substrate-binding domain-containing protein [Streptosporangium soli]|nr:substrate-binding domain-containing protein [Streptosporangium sp. KLBMP 9127]
MPLTPISNAPRARQGPQPGLADGPLGVRARRRGTARGPYARAAAGTTSRSSNAFAFPGPPEGATRHARRGAAAGSRVAVCRAEGVEPDAVFAANGLMTVGVMDCLVDSGVRVPDDFGVVGFDDIPWAHLVRPSLTTVAQPTYDLGRTAAQLLLERVREPKRAPSTVELKTELRVRDSSVPSRPPAVEAAGG